MLINLFDRCVPNYPARKIIKKFEEFMSFYEEKESLCEEKKVKKEGKAREERRKRECRRD